MKADRDEASPYAAMLAAQVSEPFPAFCSFRFLGAVSVKMGCGTMYSDNTDRCFKGAYCIRNHTEVNHLRFVLCRKCIKWMCNGMFIGMAYIYDTTPEFR